MPSEVKVAVVPLSGVLTEVSEVWPHVTVPANGMAWPAALKVASEKTRVPPSLITVSGGNTLQEATSVAAIWHRPPRQTSPPEHSESSPQAAGRQMRSSHTEVGGQSAEVVQIWTHWWNGVQAHFAEFPLWQSTRLWQTQFASTSGGVPPTQPVMTAVQFPAVQVSVEAQVRPQTPQLVLSVWRSAQRPAQKFGQVHAPAAQTPPVPTSKMQLSSAVASLSTTPSQSLSFPSHTSMSGLQRQTFPLTPVCGPHVQPATQSDAEEQPTVQVPPPSAPGTQVPPPHSSLAEHGIPTGEWWPASVPASTPASIEPPSTAKSVRGEEHAASSSAHAPTRIKPVWFMEHPSAVVPKAYAHRPR
jgi:hypothetical protein